MPPFGPAQENKIAIVAPQVTRLGSRREDRPDGSHARSWACSMLSERGVTNAKARGMMLMEPQSKPGPLIVIINDDTDFLTLMSDLLTDVEGYEVKVCREGNHAYQFVKEHQPDLVILDIRIEGQDIGWAILECLTLDPKTRPIPLIVCSAAIRQLQAHQELLDLYGIDVLTKPFDLDTLLEKVASGLSRGSRRNEGSVAPGRGEAGESRDCRSRLHGSQP
jgi:CheY-like chemotaxis protein